MAPADIVLRFAAGPDETFRVVKHNFFGDVSSYALDYRRFSANRRIDPVNNHITDAWVARTNGHQGLLVAQQTAESSNFAFCPMRSTRSSNR